MQDVGAQQGPVFLAPAGSEQVLHSGVGGSHPMSEKSSAEPSNDLQDIPLVSVPVYNQQCSAVLGRADSSASVITSVGTEREEE